MTVSRRIDRISVSKGPVGYASAMFTTPAGFSDHNAVVLQFIGMGMDGVQPVRWKFPLDALQHEDTVEWIRLELQSIHDSRSRGLEAFARCQGVLRDATPAYMYLKGILRRSSLEYVPLAGFAALREEGQRPTTMRDAYASLVRLVSMYRGVEQIERAYTRVPEVLQYRHHMQEARKWHSKALHRLMHQTEESRVYAALRARSGHMLQDWRIRRRRASVLLGLSDGRGEGVGGGVCGVAECPSAACAVAHSGPTAVESLLASPC